VQIEVRERCDGPKKRRAGRHDGPGADLRSPEVTQIALSRL
jgi:hypothetical protein